LGPTKSALSTKLADPISRKNKRKKGGEKERKQETRKKGGTTVWGKNSDKKHGVNKKRRERPGLNSTTGESVGGESKKQEKSPRIPSVSQ